MDIAFGASIYFLVGVLGLVAAAALLLWAASRRTQVERWRRVPAYIRRARVVEHREGGSRWYEPRVEYEYTVDGRRLEGHTIAEPGIGHARRARADALILRYAPDTVAELHVDPRDPTHAVLEARGPGAAAHGLLWALALITALAALGAILATR